MELKECFLCGRNGKGDRLERHHIFGGANRDKSEKFNLTVWLCGERCHRNGKLSAHQNSQVADYLHRYGEAKFIEESGTREEFVTLFGKDYLS